VLDLASDIYMSDEEKDLEVLLLRQQLWIIERKQKRGPNIPRWQKVPLAALAVRLKTTRHIPTRCLRNVFGSLERV
jgi:hypothetical protein